MAAWVAAFQHVPPAVLPPCPHTACACSSLACNSPVAASACDVPMQCGADGRDIMQLHVEAVMTRTPKTVGSQEMAVDAMQASAAGASRVELLQAAGSSCAAPYT